MKNRFIAILLLFLLAFFVSCENVKYMSGDSSEETSAVDASVDISEESDALPEITPRELRIITEYPEAFSDSESSPKIISKAVTERNEYLEKHCGIKVISFAKTENQIQQEVSAGLASGATTCDILSVSTGNAVKLYLAGALGDMTTLGLDIESEGFDTDNIKSLATNKTLYLLPDESNLMYDDIYVMFYNRELTDKSGDFSPETLALQGKWTWDSFNEIARASAPDVYKKYSSNLATDTFGYAGYYDTYDTLSAIWVSADNKIIDNNYQNDVSRSMSYDDVLPIVTKLRGIYDTRGKYAYNGDRASKAFTDGRIVFMIHKLDYLHALRNGSEEGLSYGFLPLPKYDESQSEYCSPVSDGAAVFAIPKWLENGDESSKSLVAQALSAFASTSQRDIRQAYIDYHIANYLTTNSETVMLTTVIESITYDFSTVYGGEISAIRNHTTQPIVDYIDYGSNLSTSFSRTQSAFNRYVKDKFNK